MKKLLLLSITVIILLIAMAGCAANPSGRINTDSSTQATKSSIPSSFTATRNTAATETDSNNDTKHIRYTLSDDLDGNGTKEDIVLIRSIYVDPHPRLIINDTDSLVLNSFGDFCNNNPFKAVDLDNDGIKEILIESESGNGGEGHLNLLVVRYTNHTLKQINFTDYGYSLTTHCKDNYRFEVICDKTGYKQTIKLNTSNISFYDGSYDKSGKMIKEPESFNDGVTRYNIIKSKSNETLLELGQYLYGPSHAQCLAHFYSRFKLQGDKFKLVSQYCAT